MWSPLAQVVLIICLAIIGYALAHPSPANLAGPVLVVLGYICYVAATVAIAVLVLKVFKWS